MSPPDDTATVMDRPAGRDTSIAALMALHERDVRSSLRRVLGRSRDEDDLVQEVFTRLVVRLRQPGEITVGAWLRGVARNLAVDEIRRRRPVPVEQARLDRPCVPSTDDGLAGSELYTCLVDGAQRLPERQRAALAASLAGTSSHGGPGVAGVASSLGVSVHAAESLLSRARVRMRAHLVGAGHGADAGRARVSTGTALGAVATVLAALGRRWRAVAMALAMAGGAASLTGAVVVPAISDPAPAPTPSAVTTAPALDTDALGPPAVPGPPEATEPQADSAVPSAAPAAAPEATSGTGTGGLSDTLPLPDLALPAVPVDLPVDLPRLPDLPGLPPLGSELLDTVADAVMVGSSKT